MVETGHGPCLVVVSFPFANGQTLFLRECIEQLCLVCLTVLVWIDLSRSICVDASLLALKTPPTNCIEYLIKCFFNIQEHFLAISPSNRIYLPGTNRV